MDYLVIESVVLCLVICVSVS